MLSNIAVRHLSELIYRPDAKWEVNLLPFGSIYWEDELPDVRTFTQWPDHTQILRMFGIRLKLWDWERLTTDDQQLWDSIRSQVPNWPFFRRLQLTDQQKEARRQAERQVEQEFETAFGDAERK